MLDNQSLNFGEEDSIHIQNPKGNFNGNFSNSRQNQFKRTQQFNYGKYINILYPHRTTGKIIINDQFQEFMSLDVSNSHLTTVSFLGPKKIGKSFLIDNLLSLQSGQVRRLMSKNQEQLLNMPSLVSYNQEGDRIIYLDNNGQISPSMFLWLYFISSIMVLSLNPNNSNQQAALFQCLVFIHNNLLNQSSDFNRPQLVIVKRDVNKKDLLDLELIRKIEQLQLFEPQIVALHMPYPGTKGIVAKQLLDVPARQLDPNFLNEVSKLQQIIRLAKPKRVNGTLLTPLTLKLLVQPLTKSLNTEQSLSPKKIWSQLNEALSINYYNQYLKSYSQELQRQFSSEEPHDKYTIYKKLANIKKKTNKKMQRFNTNNTDPIFQKYQYKLQQAIKSKETLVKNVNQAKSRQTHQNNYNNMVAQINKSNFDQLINQYCKTKLDDQKVEVLLQNFENLLKNRKDFSPITIQASPIANAVRASKKVPSKDLQNISKQLAQIDKLIVQKSNIKNIKTGNIDIFKSSISNKVARLEALKSQYNELVNEPQPQFILNQHKNDQLNQLEYERQRINNHINEYDREIEQLRRTSDSHWKQKADKLQQQLRRQQEQLKRLKSRPSSQIPYKSKAGQAEKSTKKTCCMVM